MKKVILLLSFLCLLLLSYSQDIMPISANKIFKVVCQYDKYRKEFVTKVTSDFTTGNGNFNLMINNKGYLADNFSFNKIASTIKFYDNNDAAVTMVYKKLDQHIFSLTNQNYIFYYSY